MNRSISIQRTRKASGRAPGPASPAGGLRRALVVGACAVALGLSGCGGGAGAEVIVPATAFDISVLVGGVALSGVVIGPGARQSVSMQVGQSIELDANEPVVWTLDVGGTSVSGSGITVYYGGAAITQNAVSSSRIVVDTASPGPLAMPVTITFVATSTIDSAQVATVDVTIFN